MIIKKIPQDFIVEEIAAFELMDKGDHAIYKLRKDGLNTEQAIEIICEICHLQRNNIKYAGAKDRNASTTQYISVFRDAGRLSIEREYLKLVFIGFSKQPLSLGSHEGNRFEIIIKEIDGREHKNFEDHIKANIKVGEKIHKLMMPNYFDDQRFSENNFEIGLAILHKDFKKAAELLIIHEGHHESMIRRHLEDHPTDYVGGIRKLPRKILGMHLHSVQSLLFNDALARVLEENAAGKNIKHSQVQYTAGKFVFYKDDSGYDSILPELQLVGFDTNIMHPYIAEQMKALNITQRDFIIRALPEMSVEGGTRTCLMEIGDLTYEKIDEKTMKIKFSLQKGSYATIVIKALFT